ncbi:MAG: hypothetical protein Q4P84_01085 [Elusimicrobiales bacterium]|nr:hypothetical protein [Elusimicrobiales bacterium]
MSEFERFSQYWGKAVHGLVGRMVNSGKALFTQRELNEWWQEELMSNRFLSCQDEAGDFLKDLRQRDYATARRVEDMLWNSRLDLGLSLEVCAVKALGAAAALSLSAGSEGHHPMWRLLFGTAGVVLAGTTASDVAAASKSQLVKRVAAAAQEQLETFRPVLEG